MHNREFQSPTSVRESKQNISLREVLGVVLTERKFISSITIAIIFTSIVVVFLLPSYFEATSTVFVSQQSSSMGSTLLTQMPGAEALAMIAGKGFGGTNTNEFYAGLLQSRTVEDAVIEAGGLMNVYHKKRMSDARKRLESNTTIKIGKDGLIHLSVEDRDPKRSVVLANAYVQGLQRLTSELALTEAGQRRVFFERQEDAAKKDLAVAEQAMEETQKKTGLIQLDSQAKAIIEAVASVRAAIAEKEVELGTIKTFATSENPDYIRVEQELEGLRVQLKKLENQQNTGAGDLQVPTGKVPEAVLEYTRRLRELKRNEAIYEFLTKQLESAKIDEAKHGALIQVVDRPMIPDKRSSPQRLLIVLISTIVGLLLTVLAAFAKTGWRRGEGNTKPLLSEMSLANVFRSSSDRETSP